jgi:hypothetical protein
MARKTTDMVARKVIGMMSYEKVGAWDVEPV